MSLKDTLTARLGDRMRASMGAGEGPSADPTPAGPPGSMQGAAGKTDGLKALRTAALIPIDRLTPDPDQPRKTFTDDQIDRLADSLRARGMLQPIRARWDQDLARWVIVAGERRFRAARRAGWAEVPCVTVDGPLTASEILTDQLLENLLREDLAPLEQGAAFKSLMDANGWSARRLAEELHISHQSVIRAVGLLELPPEVRDQVESGELSPRAAAEIATLEARGAEGRRRPGGIRLAQPGRSRRGRQGPEDGAGGCSPGDQPHRAEAGGRLEAEPVGPARRPARDRACHAGGGDEAAPAEVPGVGGRGRLSRTPARCRVALVAAHHAADEGRGLRGLGAAMTITPA